MNKELLYNLKESILEVVDIAKERWFEKRTKNHIDLVKKAAAKIVKKYPDYEALLDIADKHDASKFKEPERTPYIELTWRHKHDNYDSYKTPGTLTDKDINDATMHHVLNNKHHPEYWNKEDANIDPANRDKSLKCLDASKMEDIYIAEMVCDWWAMSEELKKNTAREWFNKQRNVRWKFTKHQEDLIDKFLKVLEED